MKRIAAQQSQKISSNVKNESQTEAKYTSLFKYCLMLTRNKWEAEDLAQESLLKALEKYGCLDGAPLALLSRIAYNERIDAFRKSACKTECKEHAEDSARKLDGAFMAAEYLMKSLTPKQAAVFLLKEAFLYKTEEIADLLGTTKETAKSLLYRGRQRLKRQPEERDPSWEKEDEEVWKEAISEALFTEDPEKLVALVQKEEPTALLSYKKSSSPMMLMAA
ncbi:hypothetical protein LRR81_19325 [Metabacillus sp. GX 13764]|uniref:sigma factor-like helix-turn-helix DNA-binding protein n=1 Tax=Metabacillus kandeliae TaxID=2900151 RepID=UPI001E5E161F|nr:sigma factor-like helix-turn-helix DNA-binding protein [Metabacillus kandeliae]MCD7036402.1 hypothetical protein [Metabacillus kandeliae]